MRYYKNCFKYVLFLENKKHCEYCHLYLTDKFFQEHQGTKKHKRNVRKWKEKLQGKYSKKHMYKTYKIGNVIA